MKKLSLVPTLVVGTIGILFGLLVAIFAQLVFDIILIVCGILTLLSGIPQFFNAIVELTDKKKIAIFDLVIAIITIAVGAIFIFWRNEIVVICIGVYLIVFPLIRTLIADKKAEQLKVELPSMILGIALLVVAPRGLIHILGKVAGALIIVLSAIYIVVGIVAYFKAKKLLESTKGGCVYVDTDGNGTIDTVFVDTTNDGNFDTVIKIDENKQ